MNFLSTLSKIFEFLTCSAIILMTLFSTANIWLTCITLISLLRLAMLKVTRWNFLQNFIWFIKNFSFSRFILPLIPTNCLKKLKTSILSISTNTLILFSIFSERSALSFSLASGSGPKLTPMILAVFFCRFSTIFQLLFLVWIECFLKFLLISSIFH